MAADGRIYTSDILTDDNLDSLIAKMRALENTVQSLMAAVQNNQRAAAALENTTQNLSTSTSSGRSQIVQNTRATDELDRANTRYNATLSATAKQLEAVKQRIAEQNRLNKLETALTNAKRGTYEALTAQYSLNVAQLKKLTLAEQTLTKEGRALVAQTNKIRSEMNEMQKTWGNNTLNVGNYASAIGGLKTRLLDFIKGGFIVSGVYAIVQGVTQLGRRAIEVNKQVSDALGDIQRIAQLSTSQVNEIFKGVKALDTRTGLNTLLELTAVGARLGVPRKELVSFTKALDSLKVALGNELGENAEEVATKLGKLTNIFDVDGEDTGEKFLRVGNAIVDLANKGVATGQFISDFSTRVAGISEISNISLGSVLGLGAGFEELGQSSEVAGTATTQLILKIGQDVPKYARLAGRSVEDFARTLQNEPVEALIQLAQGISTNKTSFAELSEAFKDAEAKGVRVSATLGVLGKNADFFRGKIEAANEALTNTGQIALATAIKQETLAAKTEKLGTAFDELVANENVQAFFGAIVGGITSAIVAVDKFIQKNKELSRVLLFGIGGVAINKILGGDNKSSKDAVAAFETQTRAAIELDDRASKLVERYNELNEVERLNADQKKELTAITQELGDLFPSSKKALDDNGKALAVNTNQIVELIRQQAKLAVVTQKEAVKAVESEIKALEKKIKLNDEELGQLQAKANASSNPASFNEALIKENEERTLNIARLKEQRDILERVKAGVFAADKAVEGSTGGLSENTKEAEKNTKAKKKLVDANEELAKQAALELKYMRELKSLLNEEGGLLAELGDELPGTPDRRFSIFRNIQAGLGNGEGGLSPLQNSIDANARKDILKRGDKIAASGGDGLSSGVGKKSGIFQRLSDGESIYDLLGIEVTDNEKDAIKSSFDFARQQMLDFLSFRTEIANRNVANADREVQAAQSALDNQITLQAAGLANTVVSRQKDLDDAKKRRDEALKQQERAARQEQLIQGGQQAANMALALSKLFATNPILAIGLGALVIGSFIGFKVAAANASKKQYGGGDFQVLQGGSHASGNDIPLGTSTKDGRQEYAEGGEGRMIIPKGATAKYRTLLPEIFQALKQKDFENQFQRVQKSSAGIPLIVNVGGGTTISTGRMERTLDLIHRQGQEKTLVDGKGRLVTTYKNLTTIRE